MENTGLTSVERHTPGFPVPIDLNIKPFCERIHDRGSNTVESSGGGIRSRTELSSRMELREHKFQPSQTSPRLDINRHPTTLVPDLDTAIAVNLHRNV